MRRGLQALVLAALLPWGMPAEGAAPAHQCDRLAAREDDRYAVAPGVSMKDMNTGGAMLACAQALNEFPSEPRFLFQYGRALFKAQRLQDAFKVTEKAAMTGYPAAANALGYFYSEGVGVSKDPKKAVEWLSRAAFAGDVGAQNNLASMYERGTGVTRDFGQAMMWYRKAADQNHAPAQYNLAGLYERGQGVNKDPEEASRWYQKAVENGYPEAADRLKELKK